MSSASESKMGLFGTIALVVSGMVGCGILILPQNLAKFGTWGFVGCALAAYMAYCIFCVFINLRKYCLEKNPGSDPSNIDFLQLVYSDTGAFLLSFGHFIALTASCSTIALALASYLKFLLPAGTDISSKLLASLSLILVFSINLISSTLADYFNQVLNVIKIFFFSLIGIVGLFYFRNYSIDFLNGFSSFPAVFYSAALSMFAFMGIEFAVFASANIDKPEENVPKGTLIGLLITTLVILGVYFSCSFVLSDLSNCDTPVASVASTVFGKWGARIFAIVPILSCLSSLNGCIVVQGNTINTLSSKGWLFEFFSRKTESGFAYLGALASLLISHIWILSLYNLEVISIIAVCFVALIYLAISFVELIVNGVSVIACCALASGLIMLCKINYNTIMIMMVMYALAYLLKTVSSTNVKA